MRAVERWCWRATAALPPGGTAEEPLLWKTEMQQIQYYETEVDTDQLGSKLRKVAWAVATLWPSGPPPLLGSKERIRRIHDWLLLNGFRRNELPSDSTIKRFFREYRR